MITRREVAIRLADYLQYRLTLKERVDWAEQAMMVVQTRWLIGALAVIGTVISLLLAIGQFAR